VAEAAMVAPMASAQPARDPLKYGQTRAILRSMDDFASGAIAAVSRCCVMVSVLVEG
jgi:hypothetical protein